MAKVDVQRANPELYEQVKSEQNKMKTHCRAQMKVARLCPYCGHKITTIYKGSHGYADEKYGVDIKNNRHLLGCPTM